MKKLIASLLLLAGLSGVARAQFGFGSSNLQYNPPPKEPVQSVVETVNSTSTCHGIAISSQVPTDVVAMNISISSPTLLVLKSTSSYSLNYTTGTLQTIASQMIREVSLQDLDSTYDFNCNELPYVSTQTATTNFLNNLGHQVAHGSPGQTVTYSLVPGTNFYCLCQKTTGSCNAVACLWR